MQIGLCHTLYLLTHCGREHQGAVFSRQRFEYLVDAVGETHIQHFIGLIQHNIAHQIEMHLPTMHQVDQASWSSHDDLHTFLQGTHLGFYGSTTIDGFYMNAIDVLGKIADVIGNLQTQLARGRKYQCLSIPERIVDPLQQWDTKGGGLTCTCLGQSNHIRPIP